VLDVLRPVAHRIGAHTRSRRSRKVARQLRELDRTDEVRGAEARGRGLLAPRDRAAARGAGHAGAQGRACTLNLRSLPMTFVSFVVPSAEIRPTWLRSGRVRTAASSFDTAPPTTVGQAVGRKIDVGMHNAARQNGRNLSHRGTLFALGSSKTASWTDARWRANGALTPSRGLAAFVTRKGTFPVPRPRDSRRNPHGRWDVAQEKTRAGKRSAPTASQPRLTLADICADARRGWLHDPNLAAMLLSQRQRMGSHEDGAALLAQVLALRPGLLMEAHAGRSLFPHASPQSRPPSTRSCAARSRSCAAR